MSKPKGYEVTVDTLREQYVYVIETDRGKPFAEAEARELAIKDGMDPNRMAWIKARRY